MIQKLVIDSILQYRNFFRRFKKNQYQSPKEIIQSEKDPFSSVEDVFLTIKLDDKEQNIVFQDPLEEITE